MLYILTSVKMKMTKCGNSSLDCDLTIWFVSSEKGDGVIIPSFEEEPAGSGPVQNDSLENRNLDIFQQNKDVMVSRDSSRTALTKPPALNGSAP